jgi:thiosulfate/3-mercaptopyruvate sulfurtransferase
MRFMSATLLEPEELAALLGNPRCAILDCRFDIARPGWGAQAYAQGHLPGAIYADLDRDLSGPVTPQSGRHPLPEPARFATTLGLWGIDAGVQVVAYDQAGGAYAARLWWMLRWMGHFDVAVLNGGFAAWQRAGLPVSRAAPGHAARKFIGHSRDREVVTTVELQSALKNGEVGLVDARGADRFAGHNETIDPVAGHVPGAVSHPFMDNLDEQGRFLAAETLRRNWLATLRGRSAREVVSMCGSGVTACQNLLALEIAGLPGARLYGGSWSEWIRDPSRPVERAHS